MSQSWRLELVRCPPLPLSLAISITRSLASSSPSPDSGPELHRVTQPPATDRNFRSELGRDSEGHIESLSSFSPQNPGCTTDRILINKIRIEFGSDPQLYFCWTETDSSQETLKHCCEAGPFITGSVFVFWSEYRTGLAGVPDAVLVGELCLLLPAAGHPVDGLTTVIILQVARHWIYTVWYTILSVSAKKLYLDLSYCRRKQNNSLFFQCCGYDSNPN